MDWRGTWVNQYGSVVRIEDDAAGRISGTFETALEDSGFYGEIVPIVGVASGHCISFASACKGKAGDMAVAYTGLLREGRLETAWHYVADDRPWWKAVITNTNTFERRN